VSCQKQEPIDEVKLKYQQKMWQFISEMPKVELHIHLEGTMNPETVSKLANRNGLDFFKTPEYVKESLKNRIPGLAGFL